MTDIQDTATNTAPPSPASDGFIPSDADNISLFPEQVIDNMMHVLVALGAEFWTMRRRMMTLERVLEKAGVSTEDVEMYTPSTEEAAAWAEERNIFIARTFAAFARTGGANDRQMDRSTS